MWEEMRKIRRAIDVVKSFHVNSDYGMTHKFLSKWTWWRIEQRQVVFALLEEAKKAGTEKKGRKMARAAYRYAIQAGVMSDRAPDPQFTGSCFYRGPGAVGNYWPKDERFFDHINKNVKIAHDYIGRPGKTAWMQ